MRLFGYLKKKSITMHGNMNVKLKAKLFSTSLLKVCVFAYGIELSSCIALRTVNDPVRKTSILALTSNTQRWRNSIYRMVSNGVPSTDSYRNVYEGSPTKRLGSSRPVLSQNLSNP